MFTSSIMTHQQKDKALRLALFFAMSIVLTFITAFFTPALADLNSGVQSATSQVTTLGSNLRNLAFAAAAIYLLWKAVEAWRGRADWGEFAMAVVYVALAGATGALAIWAWDAFA